MIKESSQMLGYLIGALSAGKNHRFSAYGRNMMHEEFLHVAGEVFDKHWEAFHSPLSFRDVEVEWRGEVKIVRFTVVDLFFAVSDATITKYVFRKAGDNLWDMVLPAIKDPQYVNCASSEPRDLYLALQLQKENNGGKDTFSKEERVE